MTAARRPDSADSDASPGPSRPPWVVRCLDLLAGLLSAGILLVGVLLLLAALIAPGALAAADLGAADGPGWGRVAAHFLVGTAGELVVHYRRAWQIPVRVSADLVVITCALLLIWWAWWP